LELSHSFRKFRACLLQANSSAHARAYWQKWLAVCGTRSGTALSKRNEKMDRKLWKEVIDYAFR